jgi:hypothetical protein
VVRASIATTVVPGGGGDSAWDAGSRIPVDAHPPSCGGVIAGDGFVLGSGCGFGIGCRSGVGCGFFATGDGGGDDLVDDRDSNHADNNNNPNKMNMTRNTFTAVCIVFFFAFCCFYKSYTSVCIVEMSLV